MGALQDRGHQAHNLKAAGSNPARERTLPRPFSLSAMATVDAKRTAGVDVNRTLRSVRPALSLAPCLPDVDRIRRSAFSRSGEGAPGRR